MPKMFQIGNDQVLRESTRTLNRDANVAVVILALEPKFGANPVVIPDRSALRREFQLYIDDPAIWAAIKDAGPDPLIAMIDQEVQRYRQELEDFQNSEGVPAPHPEIFPEVIEFLVHKEYTVVDID